MKHKKLLAILTLTTLLISTTNLQYVNANVDIGFEVSDKNEINIPAFPEDIDKTPTNWSEVDWDTETVLPADKIAYEKKLEELLESGDFDAVKNLQMKKTTLSDDASFEIYEVPKEVQVVVKDHYENNDGISVQGVGESLSDKLKAVAAIPSTLGRGLGGGQIIEGDIIKELPEISKDELSTLNNIFLQAISLGEANIGNIKLEEQKDENIGISVQAVDTPLMEYYDGISSNHVDYALYYLESTQAENGLIGNNSVRNTYELLQLLKAFKKTDNAAYFKAKNYFLNLEPGNNLELAYKIQVMKDEGEDYSSLFTTLKNSINTDKGVSLISGYDSDIYTTIEALNLFIDENDSFADPLNYILENISDTGDIKYSPEGGNNSFLLSYKVLEIFKKIDFTLEESYVTKLRTNIGENTNKNTLESSLYGLLLENDNNVPDDVSFLKETIKWEQSFDGSFSDALTSIYTSAFLAEADLVIETVVPVGTMKHKDPAKLTLAIKNNGYKTSNTVGLHTYTDKYYHAGKATIIGEVIQSNEILLLDLDFSSTPRFKGDVEFDFFLDNVGDKNYEDNWFNTTLNFISATDNSPVLPMNFSAFSHESSDGLGIAAIWNNTNDSDSKENVILVRNKGETDWKEVVLNKTLYPEGAFISGFSENEEVEVTMGVRSVHDNTLSYFSNYAEFTITSTANKVISQVNGKILSNNLGVYNEHLKSNGYRTYSEPGGDFDISVPAGDSILYLDENYGYESFEHSITVDGVNNLSGYEYHTRLKTDTEIPVMSNLKFSDNFAVKNRKTKDIIISATDNIGVKEFHLYYYDPNYSAWIFENSMVPEYGLSTYTWNIPESLVGTGYTLKAVALDYRGNESLPLEYGPFEIVDGSAPEGTIEITGLEAGSKWKLGDTKEFAWNVDLVYDLREIVNVTLHYENASTYIASSIDITKTSEAYTIPIDSKYLANIGHISLLACDIQNNCSTLESPRFEIYEEDFQSKGPWNQPSDIGISLSNGDYNRFISNVFFGDNGEIEVIYSEFNKFTGRSYRLVHRKYANGAWGSENVIKQFNNPSSGPSHSFNSIQSTKFGNKIGITYSDFYKDLTLPGFGYDDSEIYAIIIDNNVLGTLTQVSNDSTLSYNPELEFDNNNFYVIWKEGYSFTTETGERILKIRNSDVNGIWQNETQLLNTSASYYDLKYQNNKLFISYVFEDNLIIKDYNYKTNSWNNEIVIKSETGIVDNKILNRNGTDIYDLFQKKITPNTTGIEKYHLIHKKVDLTGETATILLEKNITAPSNLESLQKYTIESKDDNTYHLVYTKLSFTENGNKISMNYSEYGDNLNTNYLVLSPATNILTGSDYLFTSKINDILKLGYVSTVGGTTKLQYVTGDFTPQSSEFGFPEFDIDVTMNLSEFRVTFILLGYRFSFWIDLF